MRDKEIMMAIRKGDEKAFKTLFYEHYDQLYRNAYRYVEDAQVAEEMVQDAFVNFWENRRQTILTAGIKSYLFVSVRNLSLNYLKSRYARQKSLTVDASELQLEEMGNNHLDVRELEHLLAAAVRKLPEKCRIIFNLSRNHGMTYQEIADELNVSKETVKSQIKIALKKLQVALKEHWHLLLLLLLFD